MPVLRKRLGMFFPLSAAGLAAWLIAALVSPATAADVIIDNTNSSNSPAVVPSTAPAAVPVAAPAPVVVVDQHDDDDDDTDYGKASFGARAAYFDPRGDLETVWFGGAQLRFYLSPALALEGSVDYRQDELAGRTIDSYPVQASLLIYVVEEDAALRPFLLGGAGWYYTHIRDTPGNSTDNRFGAHAGGGLQLKVADYWSLDGSYRYLWIESPGSDTNQVFNKDYDDSGHMITIGLNYHF